MRIFQWLRSFPWFRWRHPHELEEEFRAHIEIEIQEKMDQGLSPEEARYAARRKFGNVTRALERAREADPLYWWDRLVQDLLYAFRLFRRDPVFTIAVIVTLALGLGINTTLFSMAYQLLWRPLPYPDPQQLLWISDEFRERHLSFLPHPTFFALREQNRTCAKIAAFMNVEDVNLTEAGAPQRIRGASVSTEFLPILGIQPLLGRNFLPTEEGPQGSQVVMLDHALWTERFGANPRIVGQNVHLDAKSYTVIGVLPPGLELPMPGLRPQVLLPLPFKPTAGPLNGIAYFQVIARLKPHVAPAVAAADLWSIERRVLPTYPKWYSHFSHSMSLTAVPLQEQLERTTRPGLLMLLAVVLSVLLIACANVAHLQLVRALARQQEFSIRAAVGAGRLRLASQLVLENLLLALLGGLGGLLLARLSLSLLRSFVPADLLQWHTNELQLPVVLFSLGLMLMVGLLTGLVPTWALSPIHRSLQISSPHMTGSRQRHVLSHLLMAGEIGMSLLLLIASALLLKSLLHTMQVPLGFDPSHLLTAKISLPPPRYPKLAQGAAFFQQLLERLQRLPGVRSAAMTTALPFSGHENTGRLVPVGQSAADYDTKFSVAMADISTDYFRLMRIPLRAGRVFTERDAAGTPAVVIVNEAYVHRFFVSGENPLGHGIVFGPRSPQPQVFTIVGVVGNMQHEFLAKPPAPEVFRPFSQNRWCCYTSTVMLRTQADPLTLGHALQQEVFALDASQPIYELLPMGERLVNASRGERFRTVGVAAFAGLALLLAAIGIYGVVSYTVSQQSHEISIRLALGARRSQIMQLVMGHTLSWACAGILAGVLLVLAFMHYLGTFLWDMKPYDPILWIGASLFLMGVALVASWIPAARASQTEPVQALREM